ncbi:ribonuclease H-like domain-containing protein [Candidatus Uhrbacteria bacterium]|nr:ribonuclease H-like domain-containing protein [Candidatus Uhrbacteria bacterium]
MSALIIDIETVGEDFDAMDSTSQAMLTRWIEEEGFPPERQQKELQMLKDGLGFSSVTGQIVAIGVMDDAKDHGVVYYQAPLGDAGGQEEFVEGKFTFKCMSEKDMLALFWKGVLQYQEIVTFNGRCFDLPFLMIRSAIHGVRVSKDFMNNRYLSSQKSGARHVDLLEQLTFNGAVRRKSNLHLWCRAFGIASPKEEGITGNDVKRLFQQGRYLDIARYNTRDLVATRELYRRWKDYLAF